VHGKTGAKVFVAVPDQRVERDIYNQLVTTAKGFGGYYSSFKGGRAIPGFQFTTEADRAKFIAKLGNQRHNHPSGRTLSAPDIEALAYPGLLTIWAHGHDGTVFGASLTENARARLPDNIVDSKIMLLNAYKDVERRVANVLQSFLNLDKIGTSPHYEGIKKITNEVWQHLVLSVLAAADIVEYRSNFSTPTEFDAVAGLSQVLRDAIPDVKRSFFNAAAKPSANAVDVPGPLDTLATWGVI
jgi:hypothetical protein